MATNYKTEALKKDVVCQSLTFGYVYDVEKGIIEEDLLTAIQDGTNLSEPDIRKLTRVEVNEIWEIIKKETYPEILDVEDDDEDDKKKA